MSTTSLEQMHQKFQDAFNSGSVDAVMALYEPEPTLVPQPGVVVTGAAAVRQAFSAFLALKPTIVVETRLIAPGGGDLAILYSRWALRGTSTDGIPIELAGQGSEVVRRQPDGSWLFVIDNPFAA